MKVELIDYTPDGINKIARLARSTRKNKIEPLPDLDLEDWGAVGSPHYKKCKEYFEKNEKFVKTLLKVKHEGVMEHINFTFHVSEVSRALTHQLVRHRIGFSYLQMSNRHAKPEKDGYVIPESFNRSWIELGNKPTDDLASDYTPGHLIGEYEAWMEWCYKKYESFIQEGIPVEDARYVLPPAFFTHISFTCNARSLRHFLELRLAKGAQWEVKELAIKIFDIVHNIYPILFDDLKDLRDSAVCDINYKE